MILYDIGDWVEFDIWLNKRNNKISNYPEELAIEMITREALRMGYFESDWTVRFFRK